MSTRRHRSRPRRPRTVAGVAQALQAGDEETAHRVRVALAPHPRRTREVALADLTRHETERRLLEEARPLLALAVDIDRHGGAPDSDAALLAAVRLAGPCPAGWCRYPNGHTGDCEPLEAA